MFQNAGLISFDHPMIKQTGKVQFSNQSNSFKLIDILLPKLNLKSQNYIISLQYGLIKHFIIYFFNILNDIIFNIILSFPNLNFGHNPIQIFLQFFVGLVQNFEGTVVVSWWSSVDSLLAWSRVFDRIRFKIDQSGGMVVVKLVIMIQDWHIDSLFTWWGFGEGWVWWWLQ